MSRVLSIVICLLFLPALHAAEPPPSAVDGPSASQGSGTIAFVRSGNIWLADPQGRGEQQLTQSGKCSHPNWSPDGKSLVYEDGRNIWTMDVDSRESRQLTKAGDSFQPAWRPGTNQVWYCRLGGQGGGNLDAQGKQIETFSKASLWSIAADGTGAKMIAQLGPFDDVGLFGPLVSTWRPDGKVVAIQLAVGGEGCGPEFYTVDGKPWRPQHLPQGIWGLLGVAWSPTRPEMLAAGVLYRGDPPGPEFWWQLNTIDQQSGTDKCVCRLPTGADTGVVESSLPTWSPDGSKLAFTRRPWEHPKDHPEVWVIGDHGEDAHKLADNADQPAWGKSSPAGGQSPASPTSPAAAATGVTAGAQGVPVTSPAESTGRAAAIRRFAYLRGTQIWLTSIDGETPTKLTTLEGELGMAQVSPDGRRLFVSAGPWGRKTVWAVDTATGERSATATVGSFALSPDGRWLAAAREKVTESRGGDSVAVILDLTTGIERPLLRSQVDFTRDSGPQIAGWSRDGGIVFLHGDNGTDASDAVFAVDPTSGRVLWHCGGRYGGTTAAGSVLTVGQKYRPEGGKDYFIWTAPLTAGSPQQRLTNSTYTEHTPSVSPDGREVAFTDSGPEMQWPPKRLLLGDLDGHEWRIVMAINNDRNAVGQPQWSADGAWLLFGMTASSDDGKSTTSAWVAGPDGGQPRRVLDDAVPLCWLP